MSEMLSERLSEMLDRSKLELNAKLRSVGQAEGIAKRDMLTAEGAGIAKRDIRSEPLAGLRARKAGRQLGRPPRPAAEIERRVAALRKTGMGMIKIAKELGISAGTVHRLVSGKRRMRKLSIWSSDEWFEANA